MPTTTFGMGTFSTVLSNTSLSTSYTDNTETIETHGSEVVSFYITYTKGSETSVDVQFEVYDAENGWFVLPYTEFGTASEVILYLHMTASVNKRKTFRRLERFETKLRVSAKANTATTDTALTVKVQLKNSRYPISGNVT